MNYLPRPIASMDYQTFGTFLQIFPQIFHLLLRNPDMLPNYSPFFTLTVAIFKKLTSPTKHPLIPQLTVQPFHIPNILAHICDVEKPKYYFEYLH